MYAEIRGEVGAQYAAIRLKPFEEILTNQHAIISCSLKVEEKPTLLSYILGPAQFVFSSLHGLRIATIFSTSQGTQNLLLASQTISFLRIKELKQDTVIIDRQAWLACSSGIKISPYWRDSVKSLLSGSGLRLKFTGTGILILSSPGALNDVSKNSETLL